MNATERYVFEQTVEQLQAEGFAIFVEPGRQMLPSFMGSYRPDAIAVGPGHRHIAIEIKSDDSDRIRRLDDIATLFQNRSDWELRVLYARPIPATSITPPSSMSSVASAVGTIRKLIGEDELRAALLMGWATFEAEARRHFPASTRWPQTTADILERLANEGIVTPTEADVLRRIAANRNQLIHGYLDIDVAEADVSALVDIIEMLLSLDPDKPIASIALPQ